ncbi:hypothetical protein SUGI_0381330 [Cryptomeria japonica]|nr:hypothetical protein SUGI_0381330 [Cryptomeria japonica]
MSMVSTGPHALAFRKGEGPPMAPPGWKWMTAEHEFLWRVQPLDFKNTPLPGVEKKCYTRRNIKNLSIDIQKQRRPQNRKSKFQNIKQDTRATIIGGSSISAVTGTSIARSEADIEQKIVLGIPVSPGQKRKRPPLHKLKVCQFCGLLEHYVGHHGVDCHGVEHHVHGLAVKQKDKESFVKHSACLHEATRVLQDFLLASGELKKKGDIPVGELRKILLNWQVTRESMKVFPMNIVRAFVLLMRNEAAPSILGRRALVRLSTKWYCKYKRFWCLLEESRIISTVEKFLRDTRSVDQFYVGQNESESGKDQCMVDPFVEGQHVDKHFSAHSVPETWCKPKVYGISESSNTVAQFGGSCYRYKPCKECNKYQAIRDTLAHVSYNGSQSQRGLAAHCANSCDNLMVGTEKQNTKLLFPIPNKEGASELEEAFLTNKTRSYFSIQPSNEAHRQNEDLLNDESLAMHDQKVSHTTIDHPYVNSGNLFDVKQRVDIAGYKQGGDKCLGNQCLDGKNDNIKVKPRGAVEIQNCNCKSCCANAHFCRGCMCYICLVSIQPDETWSYIKCSCHHIFHIECTLQERIGGVVEEKNIDGEFLCPVCSVKCDLFPFWRERVKNALDNESKDIAHKHLKSAISAMDGTQRKSLKEMNIKLLSAFESVTYTPFSDLRRLLVSILEDVNTQKIAKENDGFLEKSSQTNEIELVQVRELANLTKRAADRDSEIYRKTQDMVATQKELLAQIQEDLKKAEAEMQLANQNAKRSSRAAKIARKRLELLQLYHRPRSVTKEQVEVQRMFYNWEVSELKRIQRMIGDINCCCEESLPELASLFEIMKQQRQKVEVAHRKMEEMDSSCNS